MWMTRSMNGPGKRSSMWRKTVVDRWVRWGWPASSTIRVARICTGRARLEQTELKERKGGGGPRTTTPPVEYVARRKADLLSHPPSGVVLSDLPELLAVENTQ